MTKAGRSRSIGQADCKVRRTKSREQTAESREPKASETSLTFESSAIQSLLSAF